MNSAKLQSIHIEPNQRRRSQGSNWAILLGVLLITAVGAYFAWPRKGDDVRVFAGKKQVAQTAASAKPAPASTVERSPISDLRSPISEIVLTVSGYIVNRERIEVSPRFMGLVKWIGVKKGDRVKKDDIVVRLDDAEQRARVLEIEGQLLGARVAFERAKIAYMRVKRLRATQNETAEREDETRLAVEAAQATIQQIEGMRDLAKAQLDWTIIRSPIDGVVLEKLAEPGELVTPQSFGGTRGPSTALLAVADMNDLQVEIDVNESDLPKIALGQRARITPEAFPDKHYDGTVAEVAPEASRQKGTLQIKVQIEKPDQFLTPELTAKVDFLRVTAFDSSK
jgi:HlyD family secretion protein